MATAVPTAYKLPPLTLAVLPVNANESRITILLLSSEIFALVTLSALPQLTSAIAPPLSAVF